MVKINDRPVALSRRQCTAVFGHIVTDNLEALCFSPLLFKLRSAARPLQGLRRVPRRQHHAETYDRTGHSEHEDKIYLVGIHICVCSCLRRMWRDDWTKQLNSEPN